MKKAINTLKKRFTTPSADSLQQHPLCGICLKDYNGEDQPIMLPCGHVFGEQCVITWAQGTTPNGRHNRCPVCRAELLPPSLHSRISALYWWSADAADVCYTFWLVIMDILGGPVGVALVVGLILAIFGAERYPQSFIGGYIGVMSLACLVVFLTDRIANKIGWKWLSLIFVAEITFMHYKDWLSAYLSW